MICASCGPIWKKNEHQLYRISLRRKTMILNIKSVNFYCHHNQSLLMPILLKKWPLWNRSVFFSPTILVDSHWSIPMHILEISRWLAINLPRSWPTVFLFILGASEPMVCRFLVEDEEHSWTHWSQIRNVQHFFSFKLFSFSEKTKQPPRNWNKGCSQFKLPVSICIFKWCAFLTSFIEVNCLC